MVHLAAANIRWLRSLKELPSVRQFNLNPADYPSRQAACGAWAGVAEGLMAYVDGLEEADFRRTPPGMPGPAW